jgi:glutamine amidotransferase
VRIVIVDYGMGNVGSIANMLKWIGHPGEVTSDPGRIAQADKLILPGVGAFDSGMRRLAELGLVASLSEMVTVRKTPILGICLGLQLMARGSEEGEALGFGWLDAQAVRFRAASDQAKLKIPHMGWNTVEINHGDTLFRDFKPEPRFYFVHSYHLVCDRPDDVLATTEYGYSFASAVQRENIMGTQFHPEKSHQFGMKLLRNFAETV